MKCRNFLCDNLKFCNHHRNPNIVSECETRKRYDRMAKEAYNSDPFELNFWYVERDKFYGRHN